MRTTVYQRLHGGIRLRVVWQFFWKRNRGGMEFHYTPFRIGAPDVVDQAAAAARLAFVAAARAIQNHAQMALAWLGTFYRHPSLVIPAIGTIGDAYCDIRLDKSLAGIDARWRQACLYCPGSEVVIMARH